MCNVKEIKGLNKMCDVYLNGKWDDAKDILEVVFSDDAKNKIDKSKIKHVASHIGIISLMTEDIDLCDRFIRYYDLKEKNIDEILTNLYTISIFDNSISDEIYDRDFRLGILEKLLTTTYGNKALYAVRITTLCEIYVLRNEYYELSDALRSAAIHLGQEKNILLRNVFKETLRKHMPLSREKDRYGYYDIEDVLQDTCPELLK